MNEKWIEREREACRNREDHHVGQNHYVGDHMEAPLTLGAIVGQVVFVQRAFERTGRFCGLEHGPIEYEIMPAPAPNTVLFMGCAKVTKVL